MTESGATFSDCRRWRYLLWRRWDAAKPVANFLMLNPSTADELKLDPTCSRARDYAERWGFGALIVTNIFAFRNTSPEQMKAAADPVGPGNGGFLGRSARVLEKLKAHRIALHALRVNAGGEPAHPLYLPGNLRPMPWR
jgi:hypothetical protein